MKITKTMRFLLVALAAAMVFSLFACTETGDGETTAPQGNETTEAPGGETTAPTGNETTEAPGNETTAPVGGEATETTAPAGGDTTAPVGGDTTETTAPAGVDTTETTAPAGGDTTETTAPAGGDTTETTAPAGGDTTETTAPAGGDTTETTAPAGGDVTEPVAGETKDNPIYVDFAADMTATVTVPAGKTYYFSSYRNIGGMLLSINGGEGTLLEGSMWAPPVFSITNEGAEDAEYALALTYPVGTQMNPEAVEDFGWIDVTLEEGDYDGYYYSYTAEADGTLTLYFYSQPDEVTGNIIVTNMNTYAQKTLLEDGVDNYGLELVIEVKAGDAFVIQVIAEPVDFVNPAAEFSWGGMFTYPLGTENNPIAPDVVWNDEYNAGSVTVTAPVGTTYYTISASGAFVTVNGGEPFALSGSVFAPPVFSITNEGEAEAEYVINVYYPAGHFMNPIVIESIEEALTANVGENTEVYYKWYATADGLLSVTTTNALASIKVNNNTQNIYGDSVDGAGTSYTPIAYGDDVQIVVTTVMDEETWTSPAAEVDVAFATEPATMVFDTTVTVTVNPGKPTVIGGYWGGMIGTIANAENINVRCDGGFYWAEEGTLTFDVAAKMGRMPSTVVIYNTGDEAAEITIEFTYPVGSFANPETIFNPTNVTVSLAFGDEDGHYYKWIAQADGTLTLACPTVEDVEYDVIIMNNRSYAQRSLVNDGADGKVSIDVKAGDEIIIQVLVIPTVADWGSYVNELNTNLTGSFVFPVGSFENPAALELGDLQVSLEAGNRNGYFYTWTADVDGYITIKCPTLDAEYDVVVTNLSTYAVKTLLEDGANGVLKVAIKKGLELSIQVVAIPDAEWNTPAIDVTLKADSNFYIEGADITENGKTAATISRDDDGNMVIQNDTAVTTTQANVDVNVTVIKSAPTKGRYVVITYKTTDAKFDNIFMQGTAADGSNISWKSSTLLSPISDGEWHVAVSDIYARLGEGATLHTLRFDVCTAKDTVQTMTIKSIEFVDSLDEIEGVVTLDSKTTIESTVITDKLNVNLNGADLFKNGLSVKNCGKHVSIDGSFTRVHKDAMDNNYFRVFTNTEGVAVGRYLVIKYRMSTGNARPHFAIFTSTVNTGDTNGDQFNTTPAIADGEWHIMVVDLDLSKTVEANGNGEYVINYVRIDPFNGSAPASTYVDFAYIGIHDDLAELCEALDTPLWGASGEDLNYVAGKANDGNVGANIDRDEDGNMVVSNKGTSGDTYVRFVNGPYDGGYKYMNGYMAITVKSNVAGAKISNIYMKSSANNDAWITVAGTIAIDENVGDWYTIIVDTSWIAENCLVSVLRVDICENGTAGAGCYSATFESVFAYATLEEAQAAAGDNHVMVLTKK